MNRRQFLTRSAALATAGCGRESTGGGKVLRFACPVQQMTDPALAAWTEPSNLYRNALEFLTWVDADNRTWPHLAESWTASEDLKTWTFTLRDGVTWSNGDRFTTEDVAFNFGRWLKPSSQSTNRTAFGAVAGFEALDQRRFALHLSRPICSIPEQLANHTCAILHRRFEDEGGDWPKNPVGTGPFRLAEFRVGESCRFARRADYWGPPPALDEIRYIDLGTDAAAGVAALDAGQVDLVHRVTIAELDLVRRLKTMTLHQVETAQTLVMRMRVDTPPFDDRRVRLAIALAADHEAMLRLAYRGMGTLGDDHHVAPSQPDYCDLPRRQRDLPRARDLVAQTGPLRVTLTVGNAQGAWERDAAQVLQQNCAEAGIQLALDALPSAQYATVWDKVPFGATGWAHRPFGVMTLDLAYRSGSVWNESRFSNAAFDRALDLAIAERDAAKRAVALGEAMSVLRGEGVIIQPFWTRHFTASSPRVRNLRLHPSDYYRMDAVGLAP